MSTVTTVAAARTDSEIEQDIQESISQRHPTDNAQWWRGLGAGTPRVIIAMYEKSTDTYRRLRLVEGLAWFGNDARAVEFLKQQSDAAGQDDVVRNAAIKSIGQSQGAKEAEFVAKYLKHNDPETRLAAAKTLQGMDDARAKAMVDQYLREEKVPWIAGKLRGQFEKPHRPLQIIASSEDLVDSAFLGVWKGYLILPKPGPLGLIVTSVIFRVEKKGATTDLKGELLIAEKKQQKGGVGGATATATACATRVFEVKGLKAKGTKLSGTVVQTGRFGTDKSGADDNAFDGELQEVAEGGGAALLRLQAPKTGATFVLRREG